MLMTSGRIALQATSSVACMRCRLADTRRGLPPFPWPQGYGGTVTCLQPLPDGRLASGSADGSIVLWDTTRGR